MRQIIFLSFIFLACGCSDNSQESSPERDESVQSGQDTLNENITESSEVYGITQEDSQHSFSARIIFTDTLGWGYQIFDGPKMMINQIHIPAIQGNKGFKSRQSAQITANFVLYKLSNNIFPPTVNSKELDSLGVL